MSDLQAHTARFITAMLDQTPIKPDGPVHTSDFEFSDTGISRVIIAQHNASPDVSVVCTAGLLSNKVFLSITDANAEDFSSALSELEHTDKILQPLRSGHYVTLRDGAPLANDLKWVAFQLLGVEGAGATSGFPLELTVGEQRFEILWAIPLNAHDLEVRKQGLMQLLQHLEKAKRDTTNATFNLRGPLKIGSSPIES